jgi:nicotinate-nucleotide adenylyltransferase
MIGSDAFQEFLSWRRPEGILRLSHLVVMRRPDSEPFEDAALRRWSEPRLCTGLDALASAPAGRIWFQQVTPLGISATVIRGLVAAGLSARYLLPDAVLAIVERDGLYREYGRRAAVSRP